MHLNKKGMTLIELMVVVAILGILAGIAIPTYLGVQKKGKRTEYLTNLQIIRLLQEKERAESGRLRAGELSGGTFTLSNLGMFGLDSFTAVLNPPEAGVLALGAVKEQPAVIEGQVVPRPLMTATLSVDHRVVDGVTAGRFMKMFAEMLENPARLALESPKEID